MDFFRLLQEYLRLPMTYGSILLHPYAIRPYRKRAT